MTVIICMDNKNGMMSNNRRQSRDKFLIIDIMKMFPDKKISINSFSLNLFSDFTDRIKLEKFLLEKSNENDICFVENIDISKYSDKITKLIVYRWDREYPSDFKCKLDMSNYMLVSSVEFCGYSHKKITREELENK